MHLLVDPVWTWSHFFFGLTYAITASFLFLFVVLVFFKPKIKICPFICRSESPYEGEKMVYYFKIVNTSLFSANDVKAELCVIERYPVPPTGMMNKRSTNIKLIADYVPIIAPFRPKWYRKAADHCLKFRSLEDIESIVKDEFKSVEFSVYLRHGLTGLVTIYSQEYSDKSEIENGKHTYGTKFGVIK